MFFFCNEGFCKAIVRYIYFFTEGGGSATMDVYIYIYMCVLSVSNIYIYMCGCICICIYVYTPPPKKGRNGWPQKKGNNFQKEVWIIFQLIFQVVVWLVLSGSTTKKNDIELL